MSETSLPFDRRGVRWSFVLKAVAFIAAPAVAAATLWLNKQYATHEEVRAVQIVAESNAGKVSSLTEFRERQEKANERTTDRLDHLASVVTALKASSEQQILSQQQATNRILDTLERMDRRTRSLSTNGGSP